MAISPRPKGNAEFGGETNRLVNHFSDISVKHDRQFPPFLSKGKHFFAQMSSLDIRRAFDSKSLVKSTIGNMERFGSKSEEGASPRQKCLFYSSVLSTPLKTASGRGLFPGQETQGKETRYSDVKQNNSLYDPQEHSHTQM